MNCKFYVVLEHGCDTIADFDDLDKNRMTQWEARSLAKKIAKAGITCTILEAVEQYSPAEPVERKL